MLASMSAEGMGPCLAVEGPTTREVFETYLERVLVPSLGSGQAVVMDNPSSHRGARVRELIEGRGCELAYLPPYSPDLDPIEEAFAKLKALLGQAGARTRGALIEAMGWALDAVTAKDARGFFEHRRLPSTGPSAMTDALEAEGRKTRTQDVVVPNKNPVIPLSLVPTVPNAVLTSHGRAHGV